MKKRVMALVVGVVLSVMMVTPCFAATTGMTKWSDVAGDSEQETVITTPVAQPTVVTPVQTADTTTSSTVAVDPALAQQAQLVTMNYITVQFYGGDSAKAYADLANFVNLYNMAFPNVLQVLQQMQTATVTQ